MKEKKILYNIGSISEMKDFEAAIFRKGEIQLTVQCMQHLTKAVMHAILSK